MCELCRRSFLRGAAAFGGAGIFASPLFAAARADGKVTASPQKLPSRGALANAVKCRAGPADRVAHRERRELAAALEDAPIDWR